MTTIGAGWVTENKDGDFNTTIKFDKGILPLTITENKRLILKPNKNKSNNVKAPDYYADIFVPDENKSKNNDQR